MTEKYIVSHDLGTSANKAVLVTVYGDIVGIETRDYPLYHPQPGFAEQDPLDWWEAVCGTTREVIKKSGVRPRDIVGMTFSSQCQTLVAVDREGNPVVPAISWLDGRSADIMRERLWTPPRIMGYNIFKLLRFLIITGGSPGQTGKDQIGKILWLQEHRPDIYDRIDKFLDPKDFIIYRLTGHMVKSVDVGVIWWLMDTRKNRNRWHPKLCRMAGIGVDMLPPVKESAAVVGEVTPEAAEKTGLLPGTPIINGASDLSAAALGSGAIEEGELHTCIGTSGWVAGHFSRRKVDIPHYTGCIGSTYPQKYYLGIAHQETAGVCLEWLKDRLLFPAGSPEEGKARPGKEEIYERLNRWARSAGPGAAGVMFTPWMYGERCPLDDDRVRAGFFNIGLNHSREHLVRAVFEGVAFNTRWAMETLEKLYSPVDRLHIIGGGAGSDTWCQIVADITDRVIHQVDHPQLAGAVGVALLAGMTLGYIESFHHIKKYIKIKREFHPQPDHRALYDRLFKEFKNIYKQNKKWYARMNR